MCVPFSSPGGKYYKYIYICALASLKLHLETFIINIIWFQSIL